MLPLRQFLAAVMLALAIAGTPAVAEPSKTAGLFINLTTDDTWAAAKAVMFAHDRALKNGHKPVVLWLNVRAVYLADKKRPSHVHGLLRDKNMSIQDMLKAFMQDGGVVLMCQACSGAAGLKQEDYIAGVKMGDWATVESYLFDPAIKTLSW